MMTTTSAINGTPTPTTTPMIMAFLLLGCNVASTVVNGAKDAAIGVLHSVVFFVITPIEATRALIGYE
jgi:hypothetical protein